MVTTPGDARERVRRALPPTGRFVLAVSGGADSMVMAHLLADAVPERIAALATIDHGTGPVATESAALATQFGVERGIPVRSVRLEGVRRSEAAWRAARWRVLHAAAAEFGAAVATAHTEDDQAETVFMRLLRGSGVRGLAGLLAPGAVRRPVLGFRREEVRGLAAAMEVGYVEDPSNADRRYLRNRVRLDLLPTLERLDPGFRHWLLAVGRRAAAWRRDVAEVADAVWAPVVQDGAVVVPRDRHRLPSVDEAALFWPEVAGRIGVALDRRGTARLAAFTTSRVSGQEIPLSGGVVVRSERGRWVLRRADGDGAPGAAT